MKKHILQYNALIQNYAEQKHDGPMPNTQRNTAGRQSGHFDAKSRRCCTFDSDLGRWSCEIPMHFSRDVVAEIGVSSHGVMASRVRELIEQLLVEYVPGHAWALSLLFRHTSEHNYLFKKLLLLLTLELVYHSKKELLLCSSSCQDHWFHGRRLPFAGSIDDRKHPWSRRWL